MTDESKPNQQPRRRDRSPSFPFVALETAIDRLIAFEKKFGRHPVPADKVGLAWNMREKSSQAYQTLAALVAFGLLKDEGSGPSRRAYISEEGRTYLRAQQEKIKRDVLKRAALRPKEIAKFWSLWDADRPPKEICLDQLILQHKYTDSAAQTFLRVYDDTIGFAGLTSSDKLLTDDDDANDADQIDDDEISWNRDEALSGDRQGAAKRRKAQPGMKEDTFAMKEGTVVLQWPDRLSQESYEDLEAWAQLVLRKVKRHVVAGDQNETEHESGA